MPLAMLVLAACAADPGPRTAAPAGGGPIDPSKQDTVTAAFDAFRLGNVDDREVPPAAPGLVLMGGGADVDAGFRFLGERANGGDFVVVRASGADSYNAYVRDLIPTLNSVTTLVIHERSAAESEAVVAQIRNAEAIFIAGGDQADYVRRFTDTALEAAIYAAHVRGVPLGGTSAGLAILGEVDFAALHDTVTSATALGDPRSDRVSLHRTLLSPSEFASERTPLAALRGTITDSHFRERDRMGRLLAFLARADDDGLFDGPGLPRGLGVSEQTAVLIDGDGSARVVGNPFDAAELGTAPIRAAYLLEAKAHPVRCPSGGASLSLGPVAVSRAAFDPDSSLPFDAVTWEGPNVERYLLHVFCGEVSVSRSGGSLY